MRHSCVVPVAIILSIITFHLLTSQLPPSPTYEHHRHLEIEPTETTTTSISSSTLQTPPSNFHNLPTPKQTPPTTFTTETTTSSTNTYKILTLGGSVTWGAALPSPLGAWPHIISRKTRSPPAVNLAIRATGADYPARCLTSLLAPHFRSEDIRGDEYDVIALEFSLNGIKGVDMLLSRLRYFFPRAIIIYVHVYSVLHDAVDDMNQRAMDTGPTRLKSWRWGDNKKIADRMADHIEMMVSGVGGYVYQLPRPDDPIMALDMFGNDWHHLNQVGQTMVADGVLKLIERGMKEGVKKTMKTTVMARAIDPEREGEVEGDNGAVILPPYVTEDLGDTCLSWFHSGDIPIPYEGGKPLALPNHKWVLEFPPSGGAITIHNKMEFDVPVYLSFLSRRHDYPVTDVWMTSSRFKDEGKTVVTLNPPWQPNHITVREFVGWAKPGRNAVTIRPRPGEWMEKFRLTSVILCGACTQYQRMLQ